MCGGGVILHADYADYTDCTGARRSAFSIERGLNGSNGFRRLDVLTIGYFPQIHADKRRRFYGWNAETADVAPASIPTTPSLGANGGLPVG